MPGMRSTVSTAARVGEFCRRSTYAPKAAPDTTETSFVIISACRPRTAPRTVSVTLIWRNVARSASADASCVDRRKNSRIVPRSSVTCFIVMTTRPSMSVLRVVYSMISGITPAPPARSLRSLDVDLAVVADHQPQRARPLRRSLDDGFVADEAVLEPRDLQHLRVVHHHRVLDLAVHHLTAVADCRERTDEAVDDSRVLTDRHRAADRRVHDLGTVGNDDASVHRRVGVDLAVDARLDLLQQQAV